MRIICFLLGSTCWWVLFTIFSSTLYKFSSTTIYYALRNVCFLLVGSTCWWVLFTIFSSSFYKFSSTIYEALRIVCFLQVDSTCWWVLFIISVVLSTNLVVLLYTKHWESYSFYCVLRVADEYFLLFYNHAYTVEYYEDLLRILRRIYTTSSIEVISYLLWTTCAQ